MSEVTTTIVDSEVRVIPADALGKVRYKCDPAKKVAICGFASSSRNAAPFADTSFEIWGLNSLYALIPRWSRWFEIHPKAHFMKDLNRAELKQIGVDHYEWLKQQPGPGQEGYRPIFMQEAYPDIPASVPWPRDAINAWSRDLIGSDLMHDYFTSTPGQMMAQAVFEGYGEIHLYGVDLLQDEEYAYQRPGCEAWAMLAAGLGVKVYVPKASALFRANYVYGYTEPMVEFGSMTPLVEFVKTKATHAEQGQQQMAAALNTINGARQMRAAVAQKITEGKDVAAITAYLAEQETNLSKQFDNARDELNKVGGQREVLVSMSAWVSHFGRGGTLEGM